MILKAWEMSKISLAMPVSHNEVKKLSCSPLACNSGVQQYVFFFHHREPRTVPVT